LADDDIGVDSLIGSDEVVGVVKLDRMLMFGEVLVLCGLLVRVVVLVGSGIEVVVLAGDEVDGFSEDALAIAIDELEGSSEGT
jgi:hypothetical protein